MNFEFKQCNTQPHLTDVEFFGVDKFNRLNLFIGKVLIDGNESKRYYKIRFKKCARPIIVNYNDLLRLNLEIEYL